MNFLHSLLLFLFLLPPPSLTSPTPTPPSPAVLPFPPSVTEEMQMVIPSHIYPPLPSPPSYPSCLELCTKTPSCTFINHNVATKECNLYTWVLSNVKTSPSPHWVIEVPNTSILHPSPVNDLPTSTFHVTSKVLLPAMPMTDTMKFSVSNVPYLSPPTRPHGTPEEGMNATYNHEAMYDPRLYMDRELYAGRGVDWLLQVVRMDKKEDEDKGQKSP